MTADPALIWVYLTREPLLWLTATLAAYAVGDACFRRAGRASWANPVLIAVILGMVIFGVFEGEGAGTLASSRPFWSPWLWLKEP